MHLGYLSIHATNMRFTPASSANHPSLWLRSVQPLYIIIANIDNGLWGLLPGSLDGSVEVVEIPTPVFA
mgnify:CR=1 FL=1